MNPELRELIDRNSYCQGTVCAAAVLLPAEDAALDALLVEMMERQGALAFHFVLMAALSAKRRVDARHLRKGVLCMPDARTLGLVAWNMTGDVAEHLLAAVRQHHLRPDFEAVALFVIAAWCREHCQGKLPPEFSVTARTYARRDDVDFRDMGFLMAVAEMTQDTGLARVFEERFVIPGKQLTTEIKESARKMAESELALFRLPVLSLIPEEPVRSLAWGQTLRRAAAKVGRNDPCPCGSGRKYKHCCYDKDAERLQRSTHVAGVTKEELHANPEPHLTKESLPRSNVYDLLRYDPARIPTHLRALYLEGLMVYKQFDRAAEAFEKLGCPAELQADRKKLLWEATKAGHRACIERLMRVPPALTDDDVHLATALLAAQDDPVKILKFLNETTQESLVDDDPGGLEGYATGLLLSPLRGLGIFVARGLVPILPREHAARLVEEVLKARDQLNLPPDDPCADIFDRRFAESKADNGKDAAALREAQARLGAKLHEVQELKESLARMQKDLARREKPTPAAPVAQPAPATDGRATQELRQKMEGLKSALKARHQERNDLRRELEKAHTDLEALRQTALAPAGPKEGETPVDHEEDWLLPAEPTVNQPLRVIEFPRQFLDSLASLPKSVGRGTMTMLGRLAAGEPAAFVGAVKLKACPSVMRQRIGIDFRLLFRLLPDRVQVVDLIPRQDLERRIKTLV